MSLAAVFQYFTKNTQVDIVEVYSKQAWKFSMKLSIKELLLWYYNFPHQQVY